MRALIASALLAAAAAAGSTAAAQPYGAAPAYDQTQPAVQVSIGPALGEKAQRLGFDRNDLQQLQRELYRSVSRALTRAGPGAPVRADLVILDAVPNRPTFEQMGRNVSLSLRSFGLGGAAVGGQLTFADGRTVPVDFRWYETDIRYETANSTWTDAERAFDRFADRVRRGDLRPYRTGEPSRNAGAFGDRFRY